MELASEADLKPLSSCPFGPNFQRYWDQRSQIFERYDEGIMLDADALFQTKPEQTALQLADKFKDPSVLDAFCGVGGVAIALARRNKEVVAIDKYEAKIRMARNNAVIYRVADRITFKQADSVSYLSSLPKSVTAVYFDPPWGGPGYIRKRYFGFNDFIYADHYRFRLKDFISFHTQLEIVVSVPSNFDLNEVKGTERRVDIDRHEARGRNPSFSLYFARIS